MQYQITRTLSFVMLLLVVVGSAPTPTQAQSESPLVILPAPTGPYAVGRIDLHVIDESREDPFAPQAGTIREIMVRLYYPAQPSQDTEPGPYLSEVMINAFAATRNLRSDVLMNVRSHAYDNAAVDVTGGSYPLLLFSPGYGLPPMVYAALLEDMASQGYIVAALSHTFTTDITIFPGDRVVYSNYQGQGQARDIFAETPVWQADHATALQYLEALNTGNGWLAGTMDFNRIGAFGHSFGGPSLYNSSGNDSRIRAVVNLDGAVHIITLQTPVEAAYMFIQTGLLTEEDLSAAGVSSDSITLLFQLRQSSYDMARIAYNIEIPDIVHPSFIDWVHYWHLMPEVMPSTFSSATRSSADTHTLVITMMVHFFDTYLNDSDPAQLTTIAQQHPEIVFDVYER